MQVRTNYIYEIIAKFQQYRFFIGLSGVYIAKSFFGSTYILNHLFGHLAKTQKNEIRRFLAISAIL